MFKALKQGFVHTIAKYRQARVIKNSGLFDEHYYATHHHKSIFIDATLHYLFVGEKKGDKPNSWFDKDWYLATNTDVSNQRISPFFHYVAFGKLEGRTANRHQRPAGEAVGMSPNDAFIIDMLWCGYSYSALNKLKTIYSNSTFDRGVRFAALWHAARWYYFTGDFQKALALSRQAIDIQGPEQLGKVTALMHAFCLQKQNLFADCQKFIEGLNPSYLQDSDIILAASNCEVADLGKLTKLNEIYSSHGFIELVKKNDKQGLSLHNLAKSPTCNHCCAGPLVSIIMPCYNAEKSVVTAIDSLLNQSWTNIEIIVVDDKSNDKTVELVHELTLVDDRVKLIKQAQNAGAYSARNKGLSVATGQFITTHDADDWSHPQKIETQMVFLERNEGVMGVCTHWVRTSDNLTFQHNWRLNTRLIHWSHSSFLFRRQVFEELGYWTTVLVSGDSEYIWRVQAKFGEQSVCMISPEVPLAFALDEDSSLTRRKSTHIKTMYNGVRHLYRESCQWWHKQNAPDLYVGINSDCPFPIPKTIVSRKSRELCAEVAFISNFDRNKFTVDHYTFIKTAVAEGLRIILYHVPTANAACSNLSDKFFELLCEPNVEVCVNEMTVNVTNTVVLSHLLISEQPEDIAEINTDSLFVLQRNEKQGSSVYSERLVRCKDNRRGYYIEKLDRDLLLKLVN